MLDSCRAKLQGNGADFTIDFQPLIRLGERSFKAVLDHLTMAYSWNNIAAAYNNNKIRWRKKTESWKTLVFPNGMYDYSDMNSFLQAQTGKVDPRKEDSDYVFSLYFDRRIYRVVILMHRDYELDLAKGGFADLLSYEKKVLTGAESHVGEMVPDITRSVDWVFIHCDLISRRVNDIPIDVLYLFSTSGLQVSYPFAKQPKRLKWHPVNKSEVYAISVTVTDGRNKPLDLNGIDITVSLIIKEE